MGPSSPADHPQQLITERLHDAGWDREEAAENFDWPDFEFHNGDTTIEFFHSPGEDWVSITLLTPDQEGQLKVAFAQHLDAVLDVMINAQNKLGPEYWEQFIEELLAIPVRVWAISGEDGEDAVELRSLKPGSA